MGKASDAGETMKAKKITTALFLGALTGCSAFQSPCDGYTGMDQTYCEVLGFVPSKATQRRMESTPTPVRSNSYRDSGAYYRDQARIREMEEQQEKMQKRIQELEEEKNDPWGYYY